MTEFIFPEHEEAKLKQEYLDELRLLNNNIVNLTETVSEGFGNVCTMLHHLTIKAAGL